MERRFDQCRRDAATATAAAGGRRRCWGCYDAPLGGPARCLQQLLVRPVAGPRYGWHIDTHDKHTGSRFNSIRLATTRPQQHNTRAQLRGRDRAKHFQCAFI